MIKPTKLEYIQYSQQYKVVPIYHSYKEDLLTPISLFLKLQKYNPCYLLESVEGGQSLGRYSIIGLMPEYIVNPDNCSNLSELEQVLSHNQGPVINEVPPFYGGFVGYFGYDCISQIHPIKLRQQSNLPLYQLMSAKVVVVYDHLLHIVTIVCNSRPGNEADTSYSQGIQLVERIFQDLSGSSEVKQRNNITPLQKLDFASNMSKQEFIDKVEIAKEYIAAGDIFQVVLSQKFTLQACVDSFELYLSLRRQNPAPYLFFLKFPDLDVVGSSPEMLVRVEGDTVETVPIAGTRPVKYDGKDELRAKNLKNDEKELAEHVMLVDLGRNDLGKISKFGTVKVKEFCKLKKFSRVMHLVSEIEGKLNPNLSLLDPVIATFPAGTLSGAPKLRAMQIIDELEPEARGIYGGAILYLSDTGNLNSCIAIRTIVVEENQLSIQAGAGIVADSVPEHEYQETLNKAQALFRAVEETVSCS